MLVESNPLPSPGRSEPRYLQVEEVFAGVIAELCPKVTLPVSYLIEGILTLISVLALEGVEEFADALFQVDVGWQGHNLNVHVCSLFKLKRAIALKHHVVHALDIHNVIEQKVSKLLKLFLYLIGQLKRMRNMPFGHEEEVFVADWSLRHRNVKVL